MENMPATPPEKSGPFSREVIIVIVILVILCCLMIGLAIGGYFVYTNFSENQALNATATTAAQTSIYEGYEIYETFDNNSLEWRAGIEENEFWNGTTSIEQGVYTWNVEEALDTFMAWGTYPTNPDLSDFDMSVLVKRVAGDPENFCYGVVFRESPEGFDYGAYTFTVCDDGYYAVNYYSLATDWIKLKDWDQTDLIVAGEWNRLSVQTQGENITCSINEQVVAQVSDSRQANGYISVYIDLYEKVTGTVWFDDFALQPK
jgi:hypothetical protein